MFPIQVDLKFYLYQILGVGIIWIGMTIFLNDMDASGKLIYYAVTSWLLLLIVLAVKKFINDRKNKEDRTE